MFDIPEYEGLYAITPDGRVWSYPKVCGRSPRKGYYKKLNLNKDGYYYAHLYKDGRGKYVLIHRLVAQAFIKNKDNLPQINHRDANKKNNNAKNLEWCDHTYNMRQPDRAKLNHAKALSIRLSTDPQKVTAKIFGITQGHVSHVKNGLSW